MERQGWTKGKGLHLRKDKVISAAGVDGIEAFYAQCTANGATIIKPLTDTPWGTKGFYVADPDGYILAFSGRPAERQR